MGIDKTDTPDQNERKLEGKLSEMANQFSSVWNDYLQKQQIKFAIPSLVFNNQMKSLGNHGALRNKVTINAKIMHRLTRFLAPDLGDAFQRMVIGHETAHSVAQQIGAHTLMRSMMHLRPSSVNTYYRSVENFTEFLNGFSYQLLARKYPETVGAMTLEQIGLILSGMGSKEDSRESSRTYGLGKERKEWFDKGFAEHDPESIFRRAENMKSFMEEFGKTEKRS